MSLLLAISRTPISANTIPMKPPLVILVPFMKQSMMYTKAMELHPIVCTTGNGRQDCERGNAQKQARMHVLMMSSQLKMRGCSKCVWIDLYRMIIQLNIVPITPFAIIIQNTSQSCQFVYMYEDVQIKHATAWRKYARKS